MQLPITVKDWTILPLSVLSVTVLVYVGVWAAEKLGLTRRTKTFAEHENLYWAKMRRVLREELDRGNNDKGD